MITATAGIAVAGKQQTTMRIAMCGKQTANMQIKLKQQLL